jgi:ATP adenylyltransferase
MKKIWAPWRMEYIAGEKKPDKEKCFLCSAAAGEDDSLVLVRKPRAFVIMNRYPYSNGHLMVAPNRHVGKIEELTDEELLEMMGLVRTISVVMQEEMSVDGLNIGVNMGKAAGAGLEEHLHVHVVPRWIGDTNYMPVIGETKVISEHLYATCEKLKKKLLEKIG